MITILKNLKKFILMFEYKCMHLFSKTKCIFIYKCMHVNAWDTDVICKIYVP